MVDKKLLRIVGKLVITNKAVTSSTNVGGKANLTHIEIKISPIFIEAWVNLVIVDILLKQDVP